MHFLHHVCYGTRMTSHSVRQLGKRLHGFQMAIMTWTAKQPQREVHFEDVVSCCLYWRTVCHLDVEIYRIVLFFIVVNIT